MMVEKFWRRSSQRSRDNRGRSSWTAKVQSFSEAFPELIFAVVILATAAFAKVFDVGARLEYTIGLVAILILTSEVLVRASFHSDREHLHELSELIQRFGMSARDRSQLGKLTRSYLDEKAAQLADLQRKLAGSGSFVVELGDLFRELEVLIDCANERGTEIRAIASQQLEDYMQPGPAKHYFSRYTGGALTVRVRRVFVLDERQLGLDVAGSRRRSQDSRSGPALLDMIRNQNLELRGLDPSAEDPVKWVYRPRDEIDTRYDAARVDVGFSVDWILFGSELLVEHKRPGDSVAHMKVNDDDTMSAADLFERLWKCALSVDQLPADKIRSQARREQRVGGTRAQEIGPASVVAAG